ncbi:hypothetical protein V5O48_013451 [Marasmius crinis-equi]|uniref:AAA+ ATPase domain-containing protein n=1 Tax=Marasmius crinis-equi TaxID=585013 RepID=A0ABR3F068_9AGAR
MVTEDNTTASDTRTERAQTVNQNYGGDQNFNTGGGILSTGPQTQYNVARDLVQSFTSAVSNPHRTLWDMVAGVKASHSSDLQFARGDCLSGTREAVLQEIHRWRLSENHGLPVCWLYGAAGVGKSAIALTIAKACERDGLAASFFFFRLDPRRNNPSALVLTIAHGLVVTRPRIGPLIDQRIAKDPRILEASLEEQYRELIVKTLAPERDKGKEKEEGGEKQEKKEKKKKGWLARLQERWSTLKKDPDLIIIDGLDECGDADTQTRILSTLFSSFERKPPTPLRFLICSRPESWIREAFDSPRYLHLTKRIVLDNSFTAREDIKAYLLHSFKEIRESPKYAQVKFPNPWPAHYVIELLVHNSSGQFIYVATVVRFIKSDFAHPFEQLRIILDSPYRVTPLAHNSPFYELDILYNIVLFSNPDHHKLVVLLTAILLMRHDASPAFLEMLFELPSGAVSLALRDMHSVLDIRGPDDIIRVYHTSFIDFLSNESRSGRFFVSPDKRTSLTHRWGRVLIKKWRDVLLGRDERLKDKSPWIAWADFCLDYPSPDVLRGMNEVYTTILSGCTHHEDHDWLPLLLAAIVLMPDRASPTFLELLFGSTSAEVPPALKTMHPVLNERGPNDRITLYHTSFNDFLLDESRSGMFFAGPGKRASLGHRWGRVLINRWKDDLGHDERSKDKSLWTMWVDFCLEIPSPDVLRDMDEVYTTILSGSSHCKDHDQLSLLLATIISIPDYASPTFLEMLFELPSGGVSLALRDMHSLLDIGGPDDIIRVYYTSFKDFLVDESRSGRFFAGPGKRASLGHRWGRVLLNRWKDDLGHDERSKDKSLWTMWADFCMEIPSPEVLREMDKVYTTILSGCTHCDDHDWLSLLLAAIIYIPHHASPTFLEELFGLTSAEVPPALRAMHPVLNEQGPNDRITLYHTSFNDFLVDESRSGMFFVSPDKRTSLAHRWGCGLMKRWKNGLRHDHHPKGKFPWTVWADFCLENPSEGASRELDQFYTTILSDSSHHDEAISTLAVVILLRSTTSVTPRYIETFLEYTPSQAMRTLREVDWLLSEGEGKRLTVAHTSLIAFLLDKSRCGRFFIDRDYHRDYFVRRWLRVYHIFSEFKGTLSLHSWHKLRVELGSSDGTLFVELRKFYQDLWDLPFQRDKWSSVIATIVALSRYTEPSLELIDLLHETSNDPEMYYYLHIGEEWDLFSPHDNYPHFFHFLKDKCHSPEVSFTPGHQDLLARRMVRSLIQLCRDLKSYRWY